MVKRARRQDDLLKYLQPDMPHVAFIEALINGHIAGTIFVDEKFKRAESCLLLTKTEFCFILGNPPPYVLEAYLNIIAKLANPKILYPHKSSLLSSYNEIPRCNCLLTEREHLTFDGNGYDIVDITSSNINQCIWSDRAMSLYGSHDCLDRFNLAIGLQDGNKFIAEAYGIIGISTAEIGVVVHEDYHRQGLATKICQVLINRLPDSVTKIYWTCDEANTASVRTAEKLGFHLINKYSLYAPYKPEPTPRPRMS